MSLPPCCIFSTNSTLHSTSGEVIIYSKHRGSILNNSMKTCPKCEVSHDKSGKYCSRTCANSRGPRTEKDKISIRNGVNSSDKVKKMLIDMRVNQVEKTCPVCQTIFKLPLSLSDRTYCSKKCYLDDRDCQYRPKPAGGYRAGSGRSKSGYYNGIYCGSTYELCWVIHSLDHDIKFIRFDGMLERDGVKYYPDFLLDDGNTIIETKGYEKQDSVDVKSAVAESYGYTVKILRKEDLLYAFDYVKQQYGTEQYHTLYDGYKPKFSYTCGHCSTEFSRDRKLKTDVIFCSRQCAGKGHRGRVKSL